MILLLALAASASLPDLAVYKDKDPFLAVRGITFYGHPLVRAAVARVVPSAAMRRMMLGDGGGPSTPIEVNAASVRAWSCQAHNCGDHQWSITIDRQTKQATVCHHDAATMGERSLYYLAPGRTEMRAGNCS